MPGPTRWWSGAGLLWVPQLAIFGNEMFTTEKPKIATQPELALVFLGIVAVEFVIGLWATVVFLLGLAEVQGFSVWKALANILLAGAILAVPLILIVVVTAVATA